MMNATYSMPVHRLYKSKLMAKRKFRRRRLRLIPIILILLLSVLGMTMAPNQAQVIYIREHYSVKSGDTLWAIASRYCDGEDIRYTVDRIMEENNLTSAADLQPGDQLQITQRQY